MADEEGQRTGEAKAATERREWEYLEAIEELSRARIIRRAPVPGSEDQNDGS